MSSTAKLTTVCNHCSRAIRFNASLLGRSAKCPGCSTLITLADSKTRDINLSEASETQLKTQSPTNETLSQHSKPVAASSVANPTNSTATSRFQSERYELRRCLGKGGFGEVWEALDRHIGRAVAIKLPLFLPKEKKKIERFMREGRAAAQLRHPNIVSVFDAGEINGQHYLAIEFVSGSPLSELGSNRSFTQQQAARMIADLARALHYAHSQKIIHRDIKPHNIVLNDKGRPQILDFGLAKSLADEAALTIDGTVMGTPAYMSPEQARGDLKNVGPASDQYSLGATLYWLLTGQALFSGPPAAVIAQVVSVEPPPPQKFTADLDDRLAAICQKSISKLPSDRYVSCLELARDLDRYLNDETVLARPIGAFGRFYRWASKNRLDAALIGIAGSVLTIAVLSSTIGYLRSNKLLAEANNLESSVKKALHEIEGTKSELQTQAEALNQAKLKSLEAKHQLEESQQAAEKSQEELRSVIAENEKLQTESKKQLAIVSSNESKSDALTKLAQEAKEQAKQVVNRPLETMSSSERMPIKDKIYRDAFSAIEQKDFQAAEKKLNQIPPQLRDTRWILQSRVIKSQGGIQVVKKPLIEVFSKAELSRAEIQLERIDSTNRLLQIWISSQNADQRNHKVAFVDLEQGIRALTTATWTTNRDYWWDFGRLDRNQYTNYPVLTVFHRPKSLLFEFRSDRTTIRKNASNHIVLRSSNCELCVTSADGQSRRIAIEGRVELVTLNSDGEPIAFVQRKLEAPESQQDSQLQSTVGSRQLNGSLQLLTVSPIPTVKWEIADEPLFINLLQPQFNAANLSTVEHRSGTKFFRSSDNFASLPFEYYDSRLRQNLFGVFSVREMKMVRLVAVARKDEEERNFTNLRVIQDPKRWSDYDESKLVSLSDSDLSNVMLPPTTQGRYLLNLGEKWGDVKARIDRIEVGDTPVFKLPESIPKDIKEITWSTSGDSIAFITPTDLWIINFVDKQSSTQNLSQ